VEPREQREVFVVEKRLIVNEEATYKRIINCPKIIKLRNAGKYLHKIRCNWKKKSLISNWK
jgi:hypothetical protein